MIIEELTTEPAESEVELRSKKHRRRRHYSCTVLGFFANPKNINHNALGNNVPREPPVFISTSKKGKKLAEGAWGNLNECLSFFVSHQFDIASSSNGFLLCRSTHNPMTQQQHMDRYIICNPVTGQFRFIPNPRTDDCFLAPPILVSEGTNVSSLDEVHHRVVAARVENNMRCLVLKTFCSSRNKWSQASLVVDSTLPWNLGNAPAFAIGEVIFWRASTFHGLSGYDSALVAYDCSTKPPGARVTVAPPRRDDDCGGGYRCGHNAGFFGPSEGKVHYGRRDLDDFEVWVLEDYERKDSWMMKHRVSLIFPGFVRSWLGIDYGRVDIGTWGPEVISFDPQNCSLIFMTLGVRTFCYDIKSRRIRGNAHSFGPSSSSSVWQFFSYEWPQVSHFDDS